MKMKINLEELKGIEMDYTQQKNHLKILKQEKTKNFIENLTNKQKIRFWIKTLFSSYSIIPEIIKTVDKIIELQASSVSFVNDIYNTEKSAYSQLEKVIDLSERKNNLINIYLMVKELYKMLDDQSVELVEKKFLYNYSTEDLARETGLSARTIYRKFDRIMDDVYEICKKRNWTLAFIESQLKHEGWLKERYLKVVTDYFKNTNYNENYNISSSEL